MWDIKTTDPARLYGNKVYIKLLTRLQKCWLLLLSEGRPQSWFLSFCAPPNWKFIVAKESNRRGRESIISRGNSQEMIHGCFLFAYCR